jgi:threonine synthase
VSEPKPHGVLARWGEVLPLTPETPLITLGEGDTPLVRSAAIERELGVDELWFKLESSNPTGSFKDRGMVVAVAKAMERGARAVLCASTGNTSASAAAYAARCGLQASILVPHGRVAVGKLAQAVAFGARIVEIEGSFDDALTLARTVADTHPIALVNSVNPDLFFFKQKTAYEICEALGDAPDALAIPVGNAGNITAYWKGFVECAERDFATLHPRMLGFQAAGAAPLVRGEPVENPQTVATAIRIGNPASWKPAEQARDESEGLIGAVSDDEILDAYRLLAGSEGLFVEPASAASIAGLRKLEREGRLRGGRVVAVLTGSGMKDPETAENANAPDVVRAPATLEGVERALDL